MKKTNRYLNTTITDYELTNVYASGSVVQQASFKTSTSADGWKYHKKNKRKLRK